MATTKHFYLLLKILSFLLTFTDSRYLASKKTDNELSDEKAPKNFLDDDIDLETFLEDYYDDLWQYLEEWDRDPGRAKKKKKEDEKQQPIFGDYDYMSDMPAGKPEVDGKKFKTWDKDLMAAGKENLTWTNGSENAVSESYGDGILEVIRANRESNSQEEYPQRNKQMRLKSIIDQVLSFRGGSPKMNETIPDAKHYNALKEIYEKNIKKMKSEEWTSSYTEKVQSFYPSCDKPKNTEEDVWSDPNSMNLLFDLHYPLPQEDSTIMIVSAKLRLYKLPQEDYLTPIIESSTGKEKGEKNTNSYSMFPVDDDRQIRVSVYWYTKSLRRNRIKKKLLDSQMLSLYGARWTEFNIRSAVRTWKKSGKNFGLVVNVEDEDGMLLPVEQYIQNMNCSKWTATARPIPSIIVDRLNQYLIENPTEDGNETYDETKTDENKQKIYSYQPFLYPIIDLRTREVPNSDVKTMALMNSIKNDLEPKILNLSRKNFNNTKDFGNFLKKNNLDLGDITKLSRVDKSVPETRNGEHSASGNFQNVAIGTPGRIIHKEADPKAEAVKTDEEMPRLRHSRKQRDMLQKTTNSNFRPRSDFNATDHH